MSTGCPAAGSAALPREADDMRLAALVAMACELEARPQKGRARRLSARDVKCEPVSNTTFRLRAIQTACVDRVLVKGWRSALHGSD
jgi:hypothetical protein